MRMSTATTITAAAPPKLKVAVIGAGAAGLAAARILSRNGIETTVLEKDAEIGGVWSYNPNSATRPMYRGLRTNLPREIMAYREYKWGGDGKSMSYVTHSQVKDYLKDYAKDMKLEELIQFRSSVRQLAVCQERSNANASWPKIALEWEKQGDEDMVHINSEVFDAVCVCNGHYAAPANPIIPGMEQWFRGTTMHSIEYDDPSIFADKTVLCIGGRASGADLAREISAHATTVYLSDTTCPSLEERNGEPITEGNVAWVPRTTGVNPDSTILFGPTCKETPQVDVIVFCSGYDYQFPFINDKSNLELSVIPGERRIKPLYEQMWHARHPSIAFIGLQHSVVPFPFFELQAEAIVSQILHSSSWSLPPLEERLEAAEKDAISGGPKEPGRLQDTHYLGSHQWDSCFKYAKFAGENDKSLQRHIQTNKAIYEHSNEQRNGLFPGGPDVYRYNSYVRDDENQSFQVFSLRDEIMV